MRALDEADTLFAIAEALAPHDPKKALEMITKAAALRDTGLGDTNALGMSSRDEAIEQYKKAYGSPDDPEYREKVYKAIDAMRKHDIDLADKNARAKMAASAAIAKYNKRRRRTK